MNKYAEALTSMVWAMEAGALQRFIAQVASVTDAQIDHTIRAITEKPELLERLHAKSDNRPANTRRRAADVSESDLDIRNGVAHIAIDGPMMKQVPSILNFLGIKATSTEAVRAEIGAALDSDRVESVMLDIDSPGGTVEGTDSLAGDVYAMRGLKPINARVDDLMASAALWVGAQAEHIEIGHSASVGSIGVFAVVDDKSRQYENKGIQVHVVSSSELKGAFIEGSHVTEAQIKDLQRNIDTYNELFIDAIARGRDMSNEDIAGLATGQMWIGAEAMDLELVDSVDTGDGVNAIARETMQLESKDNPGWRHKKKKKKKDASVTRGYEYPHEEAARLVASGAPIIERVGMNAFAVSGKGDDVLSQATATIFSTTNAAPAAQQEQETMTEEEKRELEQLRADNAALKIKTEAQEAEAERARVEAEAEQKARKKALLTEYADRFPEPAVRESVTQMIETMTPDLAETYLKALPKITRPDRDSTAEVVEGVLAQAQHGGKVTLEEHALAKTFGQSPERLRDMIAIGDAVEKVEYEREEIDGKVMMVPRAVMKDGTRLDRKELKKALGLKGALAGIVFLIASLIASNADATALSAARATQCRLRGITKSYLMTASQTIYAGSLVLIDSNGTAIPAASSASNQNVAGVAQETKTSAASGSYWIRVSDGVICKFAGATLGQDDVGVIVYAIDDQTVDETIGTNTGVAGVLVQYVSASVGWVYVSSLINFGRVATTADPTTMSGDLTLGGGTGALTFTGTPTVTIPDNSATALGIGLNEAAGSLIVIDTTDSNEEVNIVGTTSTSALRVDTGFFTADEQAVLTGGATAAAAYVCSATGADCFTLSGAAPTMTLADNKAAALSIKTSGTASDFIVIDTTSGAEELTLKGDTTVNVLRVDTGTVTFDETLTIAGGAGALTFNNTAASIVTIDNDASALDIGSAGVTSAMRYVSTDNSENFTIAAGAGMIHSFTAITGAVSLDPSDCGKNFSVSAGIDTNTITLPDADAVLGCELSFSYIGADAGALLDITPLDSDADGIEGGCYETATDTIVYFSGTADADIGLTKATGLTGDMITLWACADAMWCVKECVGIWANN